MAAAARPNIRSVRLFKKHNLLALVCYLTIPAVVIFGGRAAVFINPEIAVRTANYSRNYHILNAIKGLIFLGAFGLAGLLWLLTCFLILKSKGRSYRWLGFALLGPLGITAISMLKSAEPSPDDRYENLLNNLPAPVRWAYHAGFFFVTWSATYALMVLNRNLEIMWESARTGVPVAQIVATQATESGMYAFSEGLEQFFMVPLFYFSWPLAFNIGAWLIDRARRRNPSAGTAS